VVYEHRGDVANITVDSSTKGYVNIGSPSEAFWLRIKVGSGTTKLRLNTYKAGMATSRQEMDAALQGGTVVEASVTPISEPLESAQYEMNVTTNSGRELGIGTLVVEKRSTNGIDAYIAPRQTNVEELDSPEAIEKATVPPWSNGTVAHDDWVVLEINASGLSGIVSKDRLDGDDGIEVTFEQVSGQINADPNSFDGSDVERFVPNRSGEGFFLLVDTGENKVKADERYNVTFSVAASSPLADERESVSTSFRTVPRRIQIDRNGRSDKIVVEGKTRISGATTLTPGTTINLTARDTGLEPLRIPKTLTVTENRTFAATYDFSDFEPGREFEFRLEDQKTSITAVVAEKETTTVTTTATTTPNTTKPTPTPTTTTTPGTTEGITQVGLGATERPLTARTPTGDESGGSGPIPGFDAVLAVVALLAAILVVRRRARR
jgi:PGF-CTERM protein